MSSHQIRIENSQILLILSNNTFYVYFNEKVKIPIRKISAKDRNDNKVSMYKLRKNVKDGNGSWVMMNYGYLTAIKEQFVFKNISIRTMI